MRRHDGHRQTPPVAAVPPLPEQPVSLEAAAPQAVPPDAVSLQTARPDAPAPRVADLDALLRDLDSLRLSVSTDLSLAAAALDAGAPDVARTVIDSDRASLLAFEQRALRHLERLTLAAGSGEQLRAEASGVAPEVAVVPRPRRRTRVGRALMPAAPLLAAAAAVLGVLGGLVPTGPSSAPSTAPASTQTAMASYAELTRLTLDGADAAQVRRAAERLHDQLESIVAQAGTDPVAAQEALALLESEALVLGSSEDRDALTQVIAEAKWMVARLKAALPPAARTPRAPAVPVPAPDVRVFVVPPAPDSGPPAPEQQPAGSPTSPEPTAGPAEATPEASPEPEPEREPEPQPARDSEPSEPSSSPQPSRGDALVPGVAAPV